MILWGLLWLAPNRSTAEESTTAVAPSPSAVASNVQHCNGSSHDQIVLVSTRNCAGEVGRTLNMQSFAGMLCSPDGRCLHQTVSLLQRHHFVETWIFVHGNQISADMALERGTRAYRNIRACSQKNGPIRFIIWSWPSKRETCRIVDARLKRKRTDAESFYFGSFLAATACNGPTSIIGYSFGARVVSGGLHLANGGCLDGFYLPQHRAPCTPYRIAFLAAAVENDGFLADGRYSRAMRCTERLLLQNNSRDKALRYFWIIDRNRPTALGHSGLECSPHGCDVKQFDWEAAIGTDHSVWQYLDREPILNRIVQTIAR